jgi:hypothetical protein
MKLNGNIGFEVVISLGIGDYEYKYLVNKKWMTDSKKHVN